MTKNLTPDQTVAFCAIVLSELALNPRNENSMLSKEHIRLDIHRVSMPHIQIDGQLSDEQLAQIHGFREHNLKSNMYRLAKLYRHFQRKRLKILNSKQLEAKQFAWNNNSANKDVDFEHSPRGNAEARFHKMEKRVSDKSMPGFGSKGYTEYMNSIYARIAYA